MWHKEWDSEEQGLLLPVMEPETMHCLRPRTWRLRRLYSSHLWSRPASWEERGPALGLHFTDPTSLGLSQVTVSRSQGNSPGPALLYSAPLERKLLILSGILVLYTREEAKGSLYLWRNNNKIESRFLKKSSLTLPPRGRPVNVLTSFLPFFSIYFSLFKP